MRSTDKPEKPVIIFGINPVAEKLKSSPGEVFELLVAAGRADARVRPLVEDARRRGVPVRSVDAGKLDDLTASAAHQGVVAAVAGFAYRPLNDLAASTKRVLVLDGLTDPRNFGALLRSAEGAGVHDVVFAKDRAADVTPVVVKSSAGAAHHMRFYRVTNLSRATQELKKAGFWVVGLDAEASETIYDRKYPEKLAVVLGSEGSGLRPLIRRECDFLVSIPMAGNLASLNVAVAGAIFLYELLRQDRQTG